MIQMHKIAALGLAFAAATMAATINPYTSQAAFNTAISGYSGTQTEAFNGVSSVFYNFSLVGGVQGPYTRGIDTTNQNFVDQVDQSPLQTTTISRQDGFNMYAAGALWDLRLSGAGPNVVITLNLAGGGTQVLTYVLGNNVGDYNGSFFFGFTSDQAFTSFTLSAGNAQGALESYTFDNLITATLDEEAEEPPPPPPSSVPEPSTLGLMGVAMVGLGLLRKVRR